MGFECRYGGIAGDRYLFLKPCHSPLRGRAGHAERLGDIGDRGPRVRNQDVDEILVLPGVRRASHFYPFGLIVSRQNDGKLLHFADPSPAYPLHRSGAVSATSHSRKARSGGYVARSEGQTR